MISSSPCPVCDSEVPEGAPEGMCPRCLITLAGSAGALAWPDPEATLPPDPVDRERVTGGAAMQTATTAIFTPGMRVGDYELLREIGRGGMGVVYEGKHIGLKRKVALKMLPWAEFSSNEQRERFRREAEAVARLHHPHIVAVYEWGNHGGYPFMAMQLVDEARSLAEQTAKGTMPPRHAARIIAKVARAVHYSHQHGVLHRDIKPGNILLDGMGEPLLVDFGLARLEDEAFKLTHSDLVFGTPSYMPPEHVGGSDITTASDVYGLGAVLYEALTGQPPFRGKTVAETMRLVTEREPMPPRMLRPEIARDLNTIVMKCLEKNPVGRYASCDALAEDLERWLENWPIRARPGTITTRALKWARRRPGVAGLAVALGIITFIGIAGLLVAHNIQRTLLWESLLSQARATRLSHQSGQRFAAIECLQRAAAIRPSIELQNEAVAALALSDLRPAETWEGNPAKQSLVALSRDYAFTAHSLADGAIIITDRGNGKPLVTLPGDNVPVSWILAFSKDGRWLAAGYSAEGREHAQVVVWDWKTARAALRVDGVTHTALDFWPDGSRVIVGVGDEIQFRRLSDGAEDLPRWRIPGTAHSVRVSSSGRFLAASMAGPTVTAGSIALLDFGSHDNVGESSLLENTASAQVLSWHPTRDWLAAPCEDGTIRVWDAAQRALIHTITGHTDQVIEAVWNPVGDLMASRSKDGTLKLWDAATGELYVSLEQPTGPLVFSSDGTRLGPGQDGPYVRLFEVAPLTACRRLRSPPDGTVCSASWSPDGSLLATAARQVSLSNIAGYELATLEFSNPRSVLFGKDGLIVTGGDGVVRWPFRVEQEDGSFRAVLGATVPLIRNHAWEYAAMSGDEKLLAVASPHEVALLDLTQGGAQPKLLKGHEAASYVAVSPDGSLIATGTSKGSEVWIWNPSTAVVITRLPVRGSARVAFTVDGKWLVTGNAEEYRCWSVSDWKPGAVHARRDDMPGPIAVSPRGTAMAIGFTRHKVRLVALPSLATVGEPDCGPHFPLCFSKDGSTFVSTNTQGHVFVWDMAWIRREVSRLQLDWGRFPPLESSHAPLVERVITP